MVLLGKRVDLDLELCIEFVKACDLPFDDGDLLFEYGDFIDVDSNVLFILGYLGSVMMSILWLGVMQEML